MIEENVAAVLARLKDGNCFHEPVTLVAATKTRTPEEIERAVRAGITDVGENRAQEFVQKYDLVSAPRKHFIGRLQTNKVKYLVGRAALIQSVDRDALAEEIALRSREKGLCSEILLEVNAGGEASKGGYPLSEAYAAFERLRGREGLSLRGFMTVLPRSEDEAFLGGLCDEMRALFERAKARDASVSVLSAGMSGDWELCLAHGSNMIRLGEALFGPRTV